MPTSGTLSQMTIPVLENGSVTNKTYDLGGGGGSDYYLEQTSVTLNTNSTTTVTFTDSKITSSSVIDIYTNDSNLTYESVSINTGTCTIVFPQQTSSKTIDVRIYIR